MLKKMLKKHYSELLKLVSISENTNFSPSQSETSDSWLAEFQLNAKRDVPRPLKPSSKTIEKIVFFRERNGGFWNELAVGKRLIGQSWGEFESERKSLSIAYSGFWDGAKIVIYELLLKIVIMIHNKIHRLRKKNRNLRIVLFKYDFGFIFNQIAKSQLRIVCFWWSLKQINQKTVFNVFCCNFFL